LRKRQEAEEKERLQPLENQRVTRELEFFNKHKQRLINLREGIGIVTLLREVRDELWKLGEVTIGEILTLSNARTTAIYHRKLEPNWAVLVSDEANPKNSYIFVENRSVVVAIIVYKSGADIEISGFERFKYHGYFTSYPAAQTHCCCKRDFITS
jgi:hypothetical protein